MIKTTIEIITPKKAAEYLQHNKDNRPLRSKYVEVLMRDMKSGNWRLTHQGIAFDVAGNLIDGQHRLTACVLCGVPFQTMVSCDVESESGRVIDVQKTRSYNDSLIFDPKDVPVLWRSAKVQAAVRSLVCYGYKQSYTMTRSQFDAILDRFRDEIEALGRLSVTQYIMREKQRGGGVDRAKVFNVAQNAIWHYINEESTQNLVATKALRYPVLEQLNSVFGGNNNA